MKRLSRQILLTLALIPQVCVAKVTPGAEDWVFVADISPFSFNGFASGGQGGNGLAARYFGEDQRNGTGAADYKDTDRQMRVQVQATREARTEYLDHLIEAKLRDDETGRLEPEVSVLSVFGSRVFFYCHRPPDCTSRLYVWRSGVSLAVTVDAMMLTLDITPGADPKPLSPRRPCPEPTEILQAYLQRYPSSLTEHWDVPLFSWIADEQRTQRFLRDEAALNLAAAEYRLADAARQADKLESGELHYIATSLLTDFVRLRERVLNGPKADSEVARLGAVTVGTIPLTKQLSDLQKIAQEYHQWWTTHQQGPLLIPPLPPLPAPTATPVSTPSVPPTP